MRNSIRYFLTIALLLMSGALSYTMDRDRETFRQVLTAQRDLKRNALLQALLNVYREYKPKSEGMAKLQAGQEQMHAEVQQESGFAIRFVGTIMDQTGKDLVVDRNIAYLKAALFNESDIVLTRFFGLDREQRRRDGHEALRSLLSVLEENKNLLEQLHGMSQEDEVQQAQQLINEMHECVDVTLWNLSEQLTLEVRDSRARLSAIDPNDPATLAPKCFIS